MPLQFGVLLDWAFSQLWISFSLSVSVFFFLTVSCNIPRLNYTRTHVRTWHAFHLFPALNRLTLQWVLCLFGVVVFKLHGVTIFAFSWRNIARNRITNCTRRRAWLFVSSLRKIRTPPPGEKKFLLRSCVVFFLCTCSILAPIFLLRKKSAPRSQEASSRKKKKMIRSRRGETSREEEDIFVESRFEWDIIALSFRLIDSPLLWFVLK